MTQSVFICPLILLAVARIQHILINVKEVSLSIGNSATVTCAVSVLHLVMVIFSVVGTREGQLEISIGLSYTDLKTEAT